MTSTSHPRNAAQSRPVVQSGGPTTRPDLGNARQQQGRGGESVTSANNTQPARDDMNDVTTCEQAIERITTTPAKRGLARAKRRLAEAKRGVFQERRDAKRRAELARDGGAR